MTASTPPERKLVRKVAESPFYFLFSLSRHIFRFTTSSSTLLHWERQFPNLFFFLLPSRFLQGRTMKWSSWIRRWVLKYLADDGKTNYYFVFGNIFHPYYFSSVDLNRTQHPPQLDIRDSLHLFFFLGLSVVFVFVCCWRIRFPLKHYNERRAKKSNKQNLFVC